MIIFPVSMSTGIKSSGVTVSPLVGFINHLSDSKNVHDVDKKPSSAFTSSMLSNLDSFPRTKLT
jgi:hypothetical protein